VKRYEVMVNGVRTTLQLSDADAAARGLLKAAHPSAQPEPAPESKAKVPANKSRQPANKAAMRPAAPKG